MEESRQPFLIFVEGCDTVPPKVPVNLVFGKGYAPGICEALKETEYAAFDFSIEPWTTANVNKGAAWVCMIDDARNGVYGVIVAGICKMTEQLYVFMGGRREGGGVEPPRAKGLTSDEFNVLARDYLKEHATADHVVTIRDLQKFLEEKNPAGTCSTETIHGLAAWRAYQDELVLRGRKGRKKKPKAVPFTENLQASVGKTDPELERLIGEQAADDDPSPLEDDPVDGSPKRVRCQERV